MGLWKKILECIHRICEKFLKMTYLLIFFFPWKGSSFRWISFVEYYQYNDNNNTKNSKHLSCYKGLGKIMSLWNAAWTYKGVKEFYQSKSICACKNASLKHFWDFIAYLQRIASKNSFILQAYYSIYAVRWYLLYYSISKYFKCLFIQKCHFRLFSIHLLKNWFSS